MAGVAGHLTLPELCDIAHVLMLERVEDRDALDEWLASEIEYVTVDREQQELHMALGLKSA